MKNNKGFLLAESLVVSTFVITVLLFLFVQFQNLMTTYKNNMKYNSPKALYSLGTVSNYLSSDPNNLTVLNNNLNSQKYFLVYDKANGGCSTLLSLDQSYCNTLFEDADISKLYYTKSDLTELKNYIKSNDDSNINQKTRDFIKRLSADEIENKGRFIAEFSSGDYATMAINNTSVGPGPITPPAPSSQCVVGTIPVPVVTTGDGMYYDNGCVYKGGNPDNYIELNGELWRIVSINPDATLNIIKQTSIGKMPFDSGRSNDWKVSSINNYLNNTYFNSLPINIKNKMVNREFSTGYIYHEREETTTSKVGLVSALEYAKASADTNCKKDNYLLNTKCANQNWLFKNGYTLTRNDQVPKKGGQTAVIVLRIKNGEVISGTPGNPTANDVSSYDEIYPVIILTQTVLTGEGTETNPYKIA